MTLNESISLSIYSWTQTTGCWAGICRCIYFLGRACRLLQSEDICKRLLVQHPDYKNKQPEQRPIDSRRMTQAQGTPVPTSPPESILKDKPQSWPATLWNIYRERRNKDNHNAITDLKRHHKKTQCWSWQWFPAEYQEKTSDKRKACAFKNVSELMLYYETKTLINEFKELADLAVRCPMNNPTDEVVLTKSLLLCLYAASHKKDQSSIQKFKTLIKQQNQKINNPENKHYGQKSFNIALESVNLWLASNECPPLTGDWQ